MTNVFPRTFPKGQSVEIIKSSIFKKNLPKRLMEKIPNLSDNLDVRHAKNNLKTKCANSGNTMQNMINQ